MYLVILLRLPKLIWPAFQKIILENNTQNKDFIKSNKLSDVNLITANGVVELIENSNEEHQLYTLLLGEIITALSSTIDLTNLRDSSDFCLNQGLFRLVFRRRRLYIYRVGWGHRAKSNSIR